MTEQSKSTSEETNDATAPDQNAPQLPAWIPLAFLAVMLAGCIVYGFFVK